MINKEVNGWFRDSGKNAGMCEAVKNLWKSTLSTSQVLDIAIANAGFCMRWKEITNENLIRLFPHKELNEHHIYVGSDKAKITNPKTNVVLFGNSEVTVNIDDNSAEMIYVLDNSKLALTVSGTACVGVNVIGKNAQVTVVGNSSVVTKVFLYAGTCDVSGDNVVIRDKTQEVF